MYVRLRADGVRLPITTPAPERSVQLDVACDGDRQRGSVTVRIDQLTDGSLRIVVNEHGLTGESVIDGGRTRFAGAIPGVRTISAGKTAQDRESDEPEGVRHA
jgi:hypothetical protein